MARYPIFYCEPVGEYLVTLSGWCEADHAGDRHEIVLGRMAELPPIPDVWPGVPCATCGKAPASMGMGGARIFRRTDTGAELNPDGGKLPIGAVYADDFREGPDGRSLVCVTPGGHWHIDSRASNCTRKEDDVHRCWVRHGRPEDGTLHVDKAGDTCAAGAGSILMGDFHGFLHRGELYDC